MTNLGVTIRQARKAKGWSLKSFSEMIGISIMTLQRIETGQVSPSVRLIVEIADKLGRPITDFIKDKERTLVRLKANRIKTSEKDGAYTEAIFPEGIINPKTGLSIISLESGAEGDWTSADSYHGYHVLEGKIIVDQDKKKTTVKAGETIYFDARFQHRVSAPEGAKAVFIYRR